MASIDVIMCAHNEAAHIAGALESLRAQTVASDQFRVIVVDNASRDATREVVDANRNGLKCLYVHEEQLGVNFAFNAGVAAATAEYVAFLDADAKAHPRWLEQINHVILNTNPDLCGGPYYPYYLSSKPAWFQDRYNSHFLGDLPRALRADEYLTGTTMVWRRSLIVALGGFTRKPALVGRGFARGDETELMVRAKANNPDFKAFYDPGIIVYHLTRPRTFRLSYWARRHFTQGRYWHEAIALGGPVRPKDWPRQLWLGVKAAGRLGLGTLAGRVVRDRARYPYYENLMYERLLPELWRLGEISAWLWPSRRAHV